MCACFWDGQIKAIQGKRRKEPDFATFLITTAGPRAYAESLQKANQQTVGMVIDGQEVSTKMLKENYDAVNIYNLQVHNGYDCSTSDPFLALLAHVTQTRVIHHYAGTTIAYEPFACVKARGDLVFQSNRRHFWS